MEPLPPENIPHDLKWKLRKAWSPEAPKEEREEGESLFDGALDLVITAACENSSWVIWRLRGIGLGGWAAKLVVYFFKKIC